MKEFRDKIVKSAKEFDAARKAQAADFQRVGEAQRDLNVVENAIEKSRPDMAKNYEGIRRTRRERLTDAQINAAHNYAVRKNKEK